MKSSNQQYSLEILVNGNPIKEFAHKGDYFVEGRKNSKFEIKITNHSARRILAIPSVDGLSVMDGKPASKNSNGYVIPGFGELVVPGWRLDNDSIAEFVFQGKNQSYAEQMGEGGNQGVIGLMIYSEKYTHYPLLGGLIHRTPWDSVTFGCNTNSIIRSTSLGNLHNAASTVTYDSSVKGTDTVENSLGTGFGNKEEHKVINVNFDKDDSTQTLLAMYYDTRKGLEKRGIKVVYKPKKPVIQKPNPFPSNGCTPPKGWKG